MVRLRYSLCQIATEEPQNAHMQFFHFLSPDGASAAPFAEQRTAEAA